MMLELSKQASIDPMAVRTRVRTAPLELPEVLRVLGDATRLEIVRLLSDGRVRTSGEVAEHVGLPASTCSYHMKQLLDAGVTECRIDGTTRYPILRRAVLDEQLPGLLALIEPQVAAGA
jgi:DNA-binding transcriptional ArsR family regulator